MIFDEVEINSFKSRGMDISGMPTIPRWPGPERDARLDAIDATRDAAKGWSAFARIIKEATMQGKDSGLDVLDAVSARDTLDDVIAAEQHCFNQLVKIKP